MNNFNSARTEDVMPLHFGDFEEKRTPEYYEELVKDIYERDKSNITHYSIRKNGKDLIKLPVITGALIAVVGIKQPKLLPILAAALLVSGVDVIFFRKSGTEISIRSEIDKFVKHTDDQIKEKKKEVKNAVTEFKNATVDKFTGIKTETVDKLVNGRYYTTEIKGY